MAGNRTRLIGAAAGVAVVAAVVAVTVWFGRSHREQAGTPRVSVSALPLRDSRPVAREVGCPSRPGTGTRAQLKRFPAAAVIWCVDGQRRYPDGEWTVVRKRVSVGSIQRFLAALDRADIPTRANEMCAAIAFAPMPIVLVTADGRTFSPRLPTDSCGQPQHEPMSALHALHFVTVDVRRAQLEQSAPAIAARCEMQWKNENAIVPDGRAGVSELGPGRLRVCWYATRDDPISGDFERGTTRTSSSAAVTGCRPRRAADRPTGQWCGGSSAD